MAARTGVREGASPGSILLVIHDFVARSSDELSLAKGDRIELIERDDDFGDGWFLGRRMGNAKTGLFPEVYTTPAPKGTLTNAGHQRGGSSDAPPKTPQSGYGTPNASPTQQRPSSASATSPRPTSSTGAPQSAASPMAQTALRASIPTSTSASRADVASPVMSETLSVIDEHMNDMNTPPSSFTNGSARDTITSDGRYSARHLSRLSYIAGHETDEEEHQLHTEEEVMNWTPERVAEYLEDHGVERAHCDIFKEQEISGEVLLAMEQSSLFLKEFDLGSVGRRLKTWHKVRALQDEVRQNKSPEMARSTSGLSGMGDDGMGDAGRNRASTMSSVLPRALETSRQTGSPAPGRSSSALQSMSQAAAAPGSPRSSVISPLQSMTSMSRAENTYRPSAQIIREMQNSRRHSSHDSTSNSIDGASRQIHRKQPSIDETWQPGQPQTNGQATAHSLTLSQESTIGNRESGLLTPTSPAELDRGYFSSNELDNRARSSRKVLTKKESLSTGSPIPSRPSSYVQNRRSTHSGPVADLDSLHDSATAQGIFGAMHSVGSTFGSIRSATSPQMRRKPVATTRGIISPVVTKLDYNDRSPDGTSSSPNLISAGYPPSANSTTSPNANKFAFFSTYKPKMTGLRTISDAITKTERMTAFIPSPVKEGEVGSPARTGSTTPSTETRSIDLQKSEALMRASGGSGVNLVPPPSRRRLRAKTKKTTSAYTRGLVKRSPAEQMIGCDYSGWMKKKSGSLMTTWKTRLFVLRGRRLSYYYSDSDTEEKGLIDISFHRVLPAHNETLTGLHATFTGAASPASPKETAIPTAAQQDLKQNPPVGEVNDGIFIFKLVPPKSGLSKGVNFTKPTVHYFAVNSRQEGRLWMAALMKATIDRDEDGLVTTTYNQKTISLAKARARRERPPALRESDPEDRAELEDADDSSGRGLGIDGIGEKQGAVAGAEREKDGEDGSSFAPSTVATGIESEQDGVAVKAPS